MTKTCQNPDRKKSIAQALKKVKPYFRLPVKFPAKCPKNKEIHQIKIKNKMEFLPLFFYIVNIGKTISQNV